jgi:hypothetical protein
MELVVFHEPTCCVITCLGPSRVTVEDPKKNLFVGVSFLISEEQLLRLSKGYCKGLKDKLNTI